MMSLSIGNRRRLFFVPLSYFLSTRLDGARAVISWIMIYPVPILLAVWAFAPLRLDGFDWLAVILAMLCVYGVYELGYMDNDVRTVRTEASPTERLSGAEKDFCTKWWWLIGTLRLLFIGALGIAVYLLVGNDSVALGVGFGVIAVVFPLYNSTRGIVNVPLHLLLVSARFVTPGAILVGADVEYLLTMLMAFPLINLLERGGEARYGMPVVSGVLSRRDTLRPVYYGILFAGALAGTQFGPLSLAPAYVLGYFFIYRLSAPIIASFVRADRLVS